MFCPIHLTSIQHHKQSLTQPLTPNTSNTTSNFSSLFKTQQPTFKMYALAPLALFLATAAAAPQPGMNLIPRDTLATMTVAEAQGACGAGQSISCCTKSEVSGGSTDSGLLSGLLNGVLKDGVLGQCSKLNVAGKTQCQGKSSRTSKANEEFRSPHRRHRPSQLPVQGQRRLLRRQLRYQHREF